MFDKKTYKETFSSLHASEDVLMEVMNMTHKTRKNLKLRNVVAIAATIAVLCCTAMAAVGFIRYENPTAMLNAFFGENVGSGNGIVEYDEDGRLLTNLPAWERVPVDETLAEELIAPYIFAVGETAVCGEYTLTVEAALFDAATGAGMIYYTVENSNGISGYEVFPDGELWWPVEAPIFTRVRSAMGGSKCYIDTATSSDTKLYICNYFIAGSAADSVDIGIGYGEDRSKVNDIVLELPGEMGMAGIEFKNGAVKLSPVSIQVDKSVLDFSSSNDLHSIVLHYADGTEYVVDDEESFISNYTYALNEQEIVTYTFNRIVDTNRIAAIEIEGVLYK